MNRRFFPIIGIFLFSLTSCSNSFNVVRKVKVVDDTRLYLGSFNKVESDDGSVDLDVIMYLDFYFKDEIVEDNLNYDQLVNLSKSDLVKLDDSLIDENGDILMFFDTGSILNDYIGSYESIGDYFNNGNNLSIFFSYGQLSDDFCITTARVNLNTSGIYYFGTVSKTGDKPNYTYSKIFKEEIQWFNPFE